jgi:hypothetical protein
MVEEASTRKFEPPIRGRSREGVALAVRVVAEANAVIGETGRSSNLSGGGSGEGREGEDREDILHMHGR